MTSAKVLSGLVCVVLIGLAGCSTSPEKSSTPSPVSSFAHEAYEKTLIPEDSKNFRAEILSTKIKDQDVIRLATLEGIANAKAAKRPKKPSLTAVDLARGAGLAPIAWMVQLPDGREFNLTGAASAQDIELRFEKDLGNVFRDNLFFQSGIVASLFPMTNRLNRQGVRRSVCRGHG